MPIEILMPALSPTMTEGTLAKWHVKEGDVVESGKVIAEIETDKATMEVEAVDEGTVGKILVKEGNENVPVNKVIALLLEDGEDEKAIAQWEKAHEKSKKDAPTPALPLEGEGGDAQGASQEGAKNDNRGGNVVGYQPTKSPDLPDIPAVSGDDRIKASPLAKRFAAENGVNLANVVGTGAHGRITKKDVEDALKSGGASGIVKRNPIPFAKSPNNTMRKTIARRLSEAKQTIPHFYLTVECAIDGLLDVRRQLNDEAVAAVGKGEKPAYKISVNDMVIKATALALRRMPECNCSWYDDAIVQYNNVDVSVAVSTDGGLITPVIRNADQKTLAQISNEMKELAGKARAGKLMPEEYEGGGFSVSNLGMFGIKEFAAIINPPQGAILAVGAGEKKLVLLREGVPDEITVMNVTLSVDHRAIDGVLGAQWLQHFKHYVENPALLVG